MYKSSLITLAAIFAFVLGILSCTIFKVPGYNTWMMDATYVVDSIAFLVVSAWFMLMCKNRHGEIKWVSYTYVVIAAILVIARCLNVSLVSEASNYDGNPFVKFSSMFYSIFVWYSVFLGLFLLVAKNEKSGWLLFLFFAITYAYRQFLYSSYFIDLYWSDVKTYSTILVYIPYMFRCFFLLCSALIIWKNKKLC